MPALMLPRRDLVALALTEIRAGAYYPKWVQHNPGVAPPVVAYLDGTGPRPELTGNRFGNALVLLEDARRA